MAQSDRIQELMAMRARAQSEMQQAEPDAGFTSERALRVGIRQAKLDQGRHARLSRGEPKQRAQVVAQYGFQVLGHPLMVPAEPDRMRLTMLYRIW